MLEYNKLNFLLNPARHSFSVGHVSSNNLAGASVTREPSRLPMLLVIEPKGNQVFSALMSHLFNVLPIRIQCYRNRFDDAGSVIGLFDVDVDGQVLAVGLLFPV